MVPWYLCNVHKDEGEPEEARVGVRLDGPVAHLRVDPVHGGGRGGDGGGGGGGGGGAPVVAGQAGGAGGARRRRGGSEVGLRRLVRLHVRGEGDGEELGDGVAGVEVDAHAHHPAVPQPPDEQIFQRGAGAPRLRVFLR